MPRPPLKQVATLAGVSEPTVSRVLNARSGVAESTRRRVLDALDELGFADVPAPRGERRSVVGIVAGDFVNPVFAAFAQSISTCLARKGYLTTIAVADPDLTREQRCIDELVRCQVDGIVFLGGQHAEPDGDWSHYEGLVERGTPIVLVNGADTGIVAPHVRCDERAGARKAVEHLIRLGHRRLGCVLGSRRFVPTERFIAGYREVLRRNGIDEPADAIAEVPFTLEGGRAGAARVLGAGITGLIAGNDLMALGAISAGRAQGRELAVVGYDGTDFTAVSNPPLTTLRQPVEDMTRLIVDALVDQIDGGDRYHDRFVFEPQLVVRESTRPPSAAMRSTA